MITNHLNDKKVSYLYYRHHWNYYFIDIKLNELQQIGMDNSEFQQTRMI